VDKVFIRQLIVPALIGVHPHERTQTQSLTIDLELATDITAAAATDDLVHALNYAAVREEILNYVKQTQFQLIETLAEKLAAYLQSTFSVVWLRLSITKKPADITDAFGVGVVIERGIIQ